MLLQKPRSPLETYNDLDGNVVNFFRVLRDRPDELISKIRLTPWARAEFELARNPDPGPLEEARRFFISAWMSISCMPHDQTTGFRTSTYWGQCYNLPAHNYFDLVDSGILSAFSKRFYGVQIENRPAEYIIARYDGPTSLMYLDPPYVSETRGNPHTYHIEWEDPDHITHAHLLRQCQGYVIISGYACPLYTELYEAHGWQRFDKEVRTNSGGKRIESVWLSPRTAEALNKPRQAKLELGI